MDINEETTRRAEELAKTIINHHGEAVTYSHMQWLSRECAKLLIREFRVSAREEAVNRKERESRNREAKKRRRPINMSANVTTDAHPPLPENSNS